MTRVLRLWRRVGEDSLVRNSLFITLSNASMGVLGFLFWIVAARFFSAHEVGVATTLFSGAILIGYASLLGFNNTFVRFLPTSDDRDAEIDTGLVLVFLSALVIGGAYVFAVPRVVPALGFLHDEPLQALAIVVFVAFGSVNLATDSVFIAYRAAHVNLVVDGLLQCGLRIVLPAFLAGSGAFGLFSAFGAGATVAVVASVGVLVLRFGYRPRLRVSVDVLRRVYRFGASNYVAGLLSMVPVLVLPLLVARQRGAEEAGYFYLAFAVANVLFTAGVSIGQSLFAEGSHDGAALRALALRSARLLGVTLVPAALVLLVGGRWVLLVFGSEYADHGAAALTVLLLAVPAVALKHWAAALLRVRHQLWGLVALELVLAVTTCGLAALWTGRGIGWVGASWFAGHVVAAAVGLAALRYRPAMASRNAYQAGLAVPS